MTPQNGEFCDLILMSLETFILARHMIGHRIRINRISTISDLPKIFTRTFFAHQAAIRSSGSPFPKKRHRTTSANQKISFPLAQPQMRLFVDRLDWLARQATILSFAFCQDSRMIPPPFGIIFPTVLSQNIMLIFYYAPYHHLLFGP